VIDHLSAISGLTCDGRLFLQAQEAAYIAGTVVGFLRQLLRQIRSKVPVIWDGAPIHKGQPSSCPVFAPLGFFHASHPFGRPQRCRQ
jgi:hypothetical protein